MTAVAEAPKPVEAPADPLANYFMPRPARGQQVLWYPHATKETKGAEVAFVRDVGARNIVIAVGGVARASVPHVDDPRLKTQPERRDQGAWDFCEADRDLVTLKSDVADLKERLAKLEAFLNEPGKKGK